MPSSSNVTVIVPVHTPRIGNGRLHRALDSIWGQDLLPDAVIVQHDSDHRGSAMTRNSALASVRTPWVAFLDSDDEFLPNHLSVLTQAAHDTGADVIYPGAEIVGAHDPAWVEQIVRFGRPFDPDLLRSTSYIPVTSLVRTGLAMQVGGFCMSTGSDFDDWCFYKAMLEAGATFVHVPVRTWRWHHADPGSPGVEGQTAGIGSRW